MEQWNKLTKTIVKLGILLFHYVPYLFHMQQIVEINALKPARVTHLDVEQKLYYKIHFLSVKVYADNHLTPNQPRRLEI